ncbi:MAG: DEAD/DEAH box helicase [Candidatus Diapherotrites archaeon]|nr:DEAD/DEAH box helicase [Candidatus Diapherotrites archaeon]
MQIVSDELSKKADKKDATNRKRPGKKSASRSGEKKTSTEFDKLVVATFKEEKQMSRKTPKAPTKVMTTYYGKVDESELRAIIGTYIKDEFTAIKYSFDGVRASYVLEFDSKRSARTAVNKLKAAQVAGFEVKLLTPEEACEKERKQQIERELHHIESAIQTLLTTQSGKVKDVQRQIEQITNEKHSDLSVVEEINTLKGKINELKAQETEFLKAANSILAELNVDSKQPTSRILEDSRRRFGLEASKFSSALPMYARRSVIIDCIRANQVSVILAETGSGKSTQVTQYMLEAGLAERGQIVCTQPRKVAAATLARRVAEEMYTTVGHLVGYKAGFVEKRSKRTKIMYVTDHVLLNECIGDPDLSRYSCIVIDEAHERSIYTDLLLGMIKKALQRRPDLHAIITSATIDPEVFVKFFGGCPVLRVPGRVFPVEVFYHNDVTACQPVDNYVALALDKVQYIHDEKEPPGDILVFLTSPKETEKACELMEKRISRDKLECLPLHGQQAPSEQQKVFGGVKNGRRKVVFSTNCAETSITIPGIKYVVDTGLAKEKSFDCTKSMSTLKICYISKSSADQRKGRAGRIEPGRCYRLYSESVYDQMKATSTPEILRTHLGLSLLKLMLLGIPDPRQFDFVQTPPLDLLETAWQSLKELDAVNSEILTDLGRQLAQLSLEPKLGKLVIEGIASQTDWYRGGHDCCAGRSRLQCLLSRKD